LILKLISTKKAIIKTRNISRKIIPKTLKKTGQNIRLIEAGIRRQKNFVIQGVIASIGGNSNGDCLRPLPPLNILAKKKLQTLKNFCCRFGELRNAQHSSVVAIKKISQKFMKIIQ
jgi:hypothetical protein